jgi:hypothetical protein
MRAIERMQRDETVVPQPRGQSMAGRQPRQRELGSFGGQRG